MAINVAYGTCARHDWHELPKNKKRYFYQKLSFLDYPPHILNPHPPSSKPLLNIGCKIYTIFQDTAENKNILYIPIAFEFVVTKGVAPLGYAKTFSSIISN